VSAPDLMIRARRVFVASLLVVGIVASTPTSVSAHAQLESSSPAASAVLENGPVEVVLDFNESITPVPRSIEIYDQSGNRLILNEAMISDEDDSVMSAGGVPELPDGVYAVVYRALSGDGHVLEGAYTFQVGTAASTVDPSALLDGVLDGSAGPAGLSWVMGIGRWLAYVGVAVFLGGLALMAGGGVSSRRSVTLLGLGWVASFVGSAAVFVLQGPYTVAGTWSDVWSTSLWVDVADTRLGTAIVVRLLLLMLLAGFVAVLRGAFERSTTSWWRSTVALAGVGTVVTFSASGHPSASSPAGLAVGVDAVHMSAVVLWFGGLAMVVAGSVLSSPDAPVVLARFSRVATWALPVAVVTGAWQTWHLVPALSDITESDWGKGLLIKGCFVVGAVTLGSFGRWLVRRSDDGGLRRIVAVEMAVGVLVFAATAGMVAKSPEIPSTSTVVELSLVDGDMIANLAVTPGLVGFNEMHITIASPAGSLRPVESVEMRMTLPNSEIPAVEVPVEVLGPNHFVGSVSVPYAGVWNVEILVSPDPSSSKRFTADVPIAP
jgi:copper transport protein